MATDLDAREITLNYEGGSLTMVLGNAKDLFGADNELIGQSETQVKRTVRKHERERKIDKGKIEIETYTHEYIQWPSNGRSNAAGGTPIVMNWTGSEGSWQARCAGPLWKLGKFLNDNSPKTVFFHALGGRGYGPYINLKED